jgi:hypothetical protein
MVQEVTRMLPQHIQHRINDVSHKSGVTEFRDERLIPAQILADINM